MSDRSIDLGTELEDLATRLRGDPHPLTERSEVRADFFVGYSDEELHRLDQIAEKDEAGWTEEEQALAQAICDDYEQWIEGGRPFRYTLCFDRRSDAE